MTSNTSLVPFHCENHNICKYCEVQKNKNLNELSNSERLQQVPEISMLHVCAAHPSEISFYKVNSFHFND